MGLLTYRVPEDDGRWRVNCLDCGAVYRLDDEIEADSWMRRHEQAHRTPRPARTQP